MTDVDIALAMTQVAEDTLEKHPKRDKEAMVVGHLNRGSLIINLGKSPLDPHEMILIEEDIEVAP
ncbi:hypothetical protein Bca52824_088479 [Brassica carinata]|uniref:Uncharacterized protein n=1 Tax=Brassica carinata TaxID=52824 RepID=A0A8X7TPM1_BRACI|nr:hypothetical protein Bca52824_088479 [Brassica carinata]